MDEVAKQREYYKHTAQDYDAMHVAGDDEHGRALALFSGIVSRHEHNSILDVGAGTGRAVRFLKLSLPHSTIVGVEPVPELRNVGIHAGGLSEDELRDGDATSLAFEDNSFDWVIETGVLHHIKDFRQAVKEMVRVARLGVLISDSNNIGQGGNTARLLKRTIKGMGLWGAVNFLQTRGKGYKWSEGDGVYYSFCAFDCVPIIKTKFSMIHYFNTLPAGFNLYSNAGHVAILAYDEALLNKSDR